MNIKTDWETEDKTTILVEFYDEWTWNDFHLATREMHQLAQTVDHTVDVILWHKVDLPNGNPLVHFRNATKGQPDNVNKVVVVNTRLNPITKRFLKTLSTVIETVYPNKSNIKILGNFEEARQYLSEKETS